MSEFYPHLNKDSSLAIPAKWGNKPMLKAKHRLWLDPVGSKSSMPVRLADLNLSQALPTVDLSFYWPLSHRIPPVSVTNSLKVTFQMLHKLIARLLVSVCVMVMFLCLERLMHYQLVLLFPLWESPFSLLGRDMSLYEGGHYKENCIIRNSDFSFHT